MAVSVGRSDKEVQIPFSGKIVKIGSVDFDIIVLQAFIF